MIEKTFVDRVPVHPGRVTLTPVPGQANVYDMVRSDSPTEPGTPLNKATFDSMTQSRLTGRYYTPMLSKVVQSALTGLIVTPIPTSGWEKNSLGFQSGGYSIREIGQTSADDTWRAFDGDITSAWAGGAELTDTLVLELPQKITVKKIKMFLTLSGNARLTTTIEGSENGVAWATLVTVSGAAAALTEYTLTNTGAYRFYRLNFSKTEKNSIVRCFEFMFSDYDVTTYRNAFTVDSGLPEAWTNGQRLTIQTPANIDSMGVVSNTLNGVPVTTILQQNRHYELTYTGSAFAAKEV